MTTASLSADGSYSLKVPPIHGLVNAAKTEDDVLVSFWILVNVLAHHVEKTEGNGPDEQWHEGILLQLVSEDGYIALAKGLAAGAVVEHLSLRETAGRRDGASASDEMDSGWTALFDGVGANPHLRSLVLADNGMSSNVGTALAHAIEILHAPLVRCLIANGADRSSPCTPGDSCTPLELALRHDDGSSRSAEIIALLRDGPPSPSPAGSHGSASTPASDERPAKASRAARGRRVRFADPELLATLIIFDNVSACVSGAHARALPPPPPPPLAAASRLSPAAAR